MTLQELFSKDGTWIQGVYARRANGLSTTGQDPNAVQFCLMGGVEKICKGLNNDESYKMQLAIMEKLPLHITKWNDHPGRTIEDVRALVKELEI